MSLVEMLPALRPVVAQLDRMAIPYYVGGSVASSIYGEPRSTLDNDLGVELPEAAVRELATNWNGEFYVSESAMRTAAPSGKSFNLIHYASVLQRRVPQEVVIDDETLSIWMATAEDVVLHKLIWFRKGNETSERQWRDIAGIDQIGVRDLLDRMQMELATGQG